MNNRKYKKEDIQLTSTNGMKICLPEGKEHIFLMIYFLLIPYIIKVQI